MHRRSQAHLKRDRGVGPLVTEQELERGTSTLIAGLSPKLPLRDDLDCCSAAGGWPSCNHSWLLRRPDVGGCGRTGLERRLSARLRQGRLTESKLWRELAGARGASRLPPLLPGTYSEAEPGLGPAESCACSRRICSCAFCAQRARPAA